MHKYGKICVTMSVVITMYFILFCIIMELCTYFWCRIITLGVYTNLFFVFIKITGLSSRWLELIWFHLYHSANGIDSVSSPVPRSKELRFNNCADSENWFVSFRIFLNIDALIQLDIIKTLLPYIKLIFMIFQRYWLRKELER